jgi:hypothetical protein
VQFCLPFLTLFLVLLSMPFPTPITAIFHEIASITFLQFDVVHFGNAARSAKIFGGPCFFIFFCRRHNN